MYLKSLPILIAITLFALPIAAFGSPDSDTPLTHQTSESNVDRPHLHVGDEYKSLNGKTIRSVMVNVGEIFQGDEVQGVYELANQVKLNTEEQVVRRELLFSEGDIFDSFRIAESERALRSLRYLRQIKIKAKPDGDLVDITVEVRDVWTLVPQFAYSSGAGNNNRSVGISESNLFGLGKRIEFLSREQDKRQMLEGVWEDPRVLGSSNRLLAAYFDRNDGHREFFSFGEPFRTLLDKSSWNISADALDGVGRLFKNAEEEYIFHQQINEISTRYTRSIGSPESEITRYSIGYDYREYDFSQASLRDYDNLNLNPATVSNDLERLPGDLRFSGLAFTVENIVPDYISMNYIDRFDRVVDYNLGTTNSANFFFAPSILGSSDDALLFSANHSDGCRFGTEAFLRGEGGISTRYQNGEFLDSLLRFESKFYNVIGPLGIEGLSLGRHTLAASFFMDFGDKLDRNRQLLVGGDNVVRGYKARSFVGNKAYGLNLEDRIHIADDVFHIVSVGSAIFLDVGGASYKSVSDLIGQATYSDIGVGLRMGFPRSANGSVLRLDLAFPLRDGPDGSRTMEIRFLVAGGQLFGSDLSSESIGAEKASVNIGFDR